MNYLQKFLRGDFGIVDCRHNRVNRLAHIVRGYVGCKSDRNTRRTVDKQVRKTPRQHIGFFHTVVEVGAPRNRIFVKVAQQFERKRAHSGFGITHSRGRVAVHRTEVAVTVDEFHSHGERLRHSHHCAVNGTVAVGVILTQTVADDTRRLLVGFVGSKSHFVHSVKDTSLHGFETVFDARQSTVENDVLGVRQHTVVHNVFEHDVVHYGIVTEVFCFFSSHNSV